MAIPVPPKDMPEVQSPAQGHALWMYPLVPVPTIVPRGRRRLFAHRYVKAWVVLRHMRAIIFHSRLDVHLLCTVVMLPARRIRATAQRAPAARGMTLDVPSGHAVRLVMSAVRGEKVAWSKVVRPRVVTVGWVVTVLDHAIQAHRVLI
jgi:hypothetical protein